MRKILVIIIVILPLSIYSQNISGELGWGKINSESSNSLFSSIVYEQSVNDKFGIITDPFFNSYEFPIFINSMLFLGKGERLRPYLVMQPGIALNTKINNPIDYYYDFGGGVAFKCKNNSLSIESRISSGFNEELEFQDNSSTVSLFYSFTFRKQRN